MRTWWIAAALAALTLAVCPATAVAEAAPPAGETGGSTSATSVGWDPGQGCRPQCFETGP